MSEKFSLIIPCKNEVESLGAVLEEIKNYNGKLIIQKKKRLWCSYNGRL